MPRLSVAVDADLIVDPRELPSEAAQIVLDELTIPNDAKKEAQAREQYGWWDLPDEFQLWHVNNLDEFKPELILPRGYALRFKQLMREFDVRVQWQDRRRWKFGAPMGFEEFSYLELQPEAVDAMRRHQQGMYEAPTGSGKSVCGIGLIWEMHPQNSLILVDRINLVTQWEREFKKHAGIDVGKIGEGIWDERRVTVATVQTLYRNIDKLLARGFFDKWDIVILDECHHVTAETFMKLVRLFNAWIRLGMSATPDKTGIYEFALAVLGPVIHKTTHDDLRRAGRMVEASVEVIHTGFDHVFWGDHRVERDKETRKVPECYVPGCKKSGKEPHGHRNNYMQCKKALIEDEARNALIAKNIAKVRRSGNHYQLIITDQTQHIDAMMKHLPIELLAITHVLTGKMTLKRKDEIIEAVKSADEAILFSTIAGEALDIPQLDRVHLPFPTKNHRKTEQNIGRGLRARVGKSAPVVYDYADVLVPPFARQFRSRRWKCYEPLGFKVIIREKPPRNASRHGGVQRDGHARSGGRGGDVQQHGRRSLGTRLRNHRAHKPSR